jgi:signal transduction histidine kinase
MGLSIHAPTSRKTFPPVKVSQHGIQGGGVRNRITLDNDGPGIPPARSGLMFRPFGTAAPGGTGLAIAWDIIGAHGGNILLLDRPGGGLRVVIEVPVCCWGFAIYTGRT